MCDKELGDNAGLDAAKKISMEGGTTTDRGRSEVGGGYGAVNTIAGPKIVTDGGLNVGDGV